MWTHGVAAALAVLAAAWLGLRMGGTVPPLLRATGVFFALAMAATFAASALYHLAEVGPRKERARRVDHAMIYVAIAATYTPFAVACIGGASGGVLAATQWAWRAPGCGSASGTSTASAGCS